MNKNILEYLNILITIILFSLIGFSVALSAISIQNDLYFGGSYGIVDVRDISLTPTSTAPASAPGRIYYNSLDQKPYIFDGSNWSELGGAVASGDFVSKTGDTMTGKLTMSINSDDMLTFVRSGAAKQYTLALGSDGTLALKDEAGTVRLKIDSSGNISIGTITPTQKLQVEGNIKLGITEGDILGANWIVGNNDLFLKSNQSEDSSVHIAGSELIFWSGSQEQWQINSTGTLLKGAVPWDRFIDPPNDCSENQYVIGMNSDGTFKCSSIDFCSLTYKCAESDGSGGCIAKPAGEYNLPACQYCDGTSLDPVNYLANVQDTTGPNLCDNTLGTCYACNGSGNCSFQTSDSDAGNQCGTSGCSTGLCSGTGYSCGIYTSGKHNCALCMECDSGGVCVNQSSNEDLGNDCPESGCYTGFCDGAGSCEYQDSDQDLWDACDVSGCNTGYCSGSGYSCGTYNCSACQQCLGDGSSCGSSPNTNWGVGAYGCTGGTRRCWGGACISCGSGKMAGGYCWYEGGPSDNCNQVCASHDGVYNGNCNWTNDPENCATCRLFHSSSVCGSTWIGPAFRELPYPPTTPACMYHYDGPSYDCTTVLQYYQRICACNI